MFLQVVQEVKGSVDDLNSNKNDCYSNQEVGVTEENKLRILSESDISLSTFLGWCNLEGMLFRLKVAGFDDLASLEPLKSRSGKALCDEFNISKDEATRFKAFLELKSYDFQSLCAGFVTRKGVGNATPYECMGTALLTSPSSPPILKSTISQKDSLKEFSDEKRNARSSSLDQNEEVYVGDIILIPTPVVERVKSDGEEDGLNDPPVTNRVVSFNMEEEGLDDSMSAVFGLHKSKGEHTELPGSGMENEDAKEKVGEEQEKGAITDDILIKDDDDHKLKTQASTSSLLSDEERAKDDELDFASEDIKPNAIKSSPSKPKERGISPWKASSRFDKEEDKKALSSPSRPSSSPPRGRSPGRSAGGRGGRGPGSGKPRDYSQNGGHHVLKPPPSRRAGSGPRSAVSKSTPRSTASSQSPSRHTATSSNLKTGKRNSKESLKEKKPSKASEEEAVYIEDIEAEPLSLNEEDLFNPKDDDEDDDPAAMLLSMKARSINDYHEDELSL